MGTRIDLERLQQTVRETVESHGYELVEFEFKGAPKQAIMRLYIDRESGISHDDCELVSDQVGAVLDLDDSIPYAYTLEVSSPGIERKLVRESDYRRFEGKLARIQTRVALNNQRVFRGRLRGLQDGKIRLELPKGDPLEIPIEVVQEARLEFDWEAERVHLRQSR